MRTVWERLERKFIRKNTILMKNRLPRSKQSLQDIQFNFKGEQVMSDFLAHADQIFGDLNAATTVLVKVNLNSAYPYPASVSEEMLQALLGLLKEKGVQNIRIGDCSGMMHLPTRKVLARKNMHFIKKYGARIRVFDYGPWARIPIPGTYFQSIICAKDVYQFDRIINLANLKSHSLAGFSAATKSLVGFMHPGQRSFLHKNHLKQKIAEIALALQPDINIIDARKIFISGGPDKGRVAQAHTVLVDSRLWRADLAAYRLLCQYKKKFGIHDLAQDPDDDPFFSHCLTLKDKMP